MSDVVGDQLDQLVEEARRKVVAHAGDGDVAGARDRVGGRQTAAGMDDQIAVAVDDEGRCCDPAQLLGAVAGGLDRLDLPGATAPAGPRTAAARSQAPSAYRVSTAGSGG